ncbi:glycoside hydrolase family 5 protein [Patellaria atrata CBS 101060]|uniref:cellulase n=1 Tax=Patellaria atrata CBS 101060 TaxID=1346257 RepID=A0A9P4VQG8_9PEZI|nr:glycoside hydrolase family 5 protein [Patellaria atrata CBS 101060]
MRLQLSTLPLFAAFAAAKIYYAGLAESSGEFGVWSADKIVGYGLPGRFGVDYAFINKDTVSKLVDEDKINTFRVAFLLERMCPLSYGLGAKFNETHFDFFKDAIDHITVTKGAYAIFDPHNYMRYNDPSQQPMTGSVIGDASDPKAATTAQFAAFWGELAGRFKDNEKVIFGLMNEPHDMDNNLVLTNNQAAINSIRAAGANQLIIAPGGGWTGGHAWTKTYPGNEPANAVVMHKLTDPASNTAFDIHEYLDVDFSGGHSICNQSAATNLAPLTAWLKQYNFKAMITEFGGDNNEGCHDLLDEMLTYMEDNPEYIGWTAWAAGPFWGPNSACCTDQRQLGSLEPGSKAANGSPGMYDTVWRPTMLPHVPADLQWEGISSINGPAGAGNATAARRSRRSSRFSK